MENQSSFESFELQLNAQAVDALKESSKWSFFLAILGFVGIGFMIIAALLMGVVMSAMPSEAMSGSPIGAIRGYISFFYLVLALIYFFPVYYLFKYASGIRSALQSKDSGMLSDALVNLKSHHKFLGISMIVLISMYILIIIGVIIFGVSSAI